MSQLIVEVYVADAGADVEVGTLYSHRRGRTESATFVYARDYVTRPGAYELDPSLPLGTAPSQTPVGQKIFGALSDCAPDRWGRTLIKRAEARIAREEGRAARALGDVDYLLGVRDDLRQGALRFRIDEGPFLATEDLGNHGFLHSGGTSWSLAPAFDLNPQPELGAKQLSTFIDTADDSATVSLATSVAPLFRLSSAHARRALGEVAAAVSGWRHVAAQWLAPREMDEMAPAFAELDAVPTAPE